MELPGGQTLQWEVGGVRTGVSGQDCQAQDCQDRTVRTGMSGQADQEGGHGDKIGRQKNEQAGHSGMFG